MSWGGGCSCFEGRGDTTMSDELKRLTYKDFPSKFDVTEEEVISQLNGELTFIDLG